MPSATNVVPYIVGENQRALEVAQRLQQRHFLLCRFARRQCRKERRVFVFTHRGN